MEENTRKRSRKSKLVVRDCSMDSDDELLVMQQEIEATLVQLKNKSILKKLSKPQITPKPVEPTHAVSVKVEVEEVKVEELNETQDCEENSNGIIIESVTSLSKPTPPLAPISGTSQAQDQDKEEYFKFSEEAIRVEFDKLSKRTTNPADKLIEMHARNILGRKRIPQETNYVDQRLMQIFRCKWKTWRNPFRDIRESPLLYKCHKCKKAWWHLYDFRAHILKHKKYKTMAIELQTNCHESYIIAYSNRLLSHSTLEEPNLQYSIQSVCWRCGNDYSHHMPLYSLTNTRYRCSGCLERFYTCSLLFNHEHTCSLYRRSIAGSSSSFETSCSQCPAKYSSEEELLQHMVLRHSVRSDVPEEWVLRVCNHCEYPFHLQVFHDCPAKPFITSCKFCAQKFNSHTFVLIHLNVTKHHFPCRICGSILRKECMELQHLMKHTQNYVIIYKCTYCTDPKYFPTVKSVNDHKANAHKGQVEHKNLGTFFDVTVVPKNMVKNMENQWIFEEDTRNNLDSAYEGFLGSLGQPNGRTGKKQKTANKNLEVNFFKLVRKGRPPKFPQYESQGRGQTQQECVITIPDSPERIEEDELEIIEDIHQNDIIDISMPDDTQKIGMNSQESKLENVNIDIVSLEPLQENDYNASDDTQENNEIVLKTPEYSQDIVEISSPEPLQESDYNMPVDMQENKEIFMKAPEIKEEIVDITLPKPQQENDYNMPDEMQENEIVMKTPEMKKEIVDIATAKSLQENDYSVSDDMQENNEIVTKTPEIKQEKVDVVSAKPLQESDYNAPDDTQENNEIILKKPEIKVETVDIALPKPQQEDDKNMPDNTQENTNEKTIPENGLENFDDCIKKSYILKLKNPGRNFPNDVINNSSENIQGQTYDNLNNIILGNIEVKTEALDENDVSFQVNENTQETYTDNLNVIPLTEVNEFDPHLVIKEENINYSEITDNIQQEPEEMHEINIENLTRIKREPMDINTDTQCNNVNIDHCYTITGTYNKLTTQMDKIISNTNMKNVGRINHKFITNIDKLNVKVVNNKSEDHIENDKLKAHNENDKLKSNTVRDHLDDIARRAILALDKLRCKKPKSSRKTKLDTKRVEIKRKINKPKGEKKKEQFRKLDIIGINELEANIARMTSNENVEKNESFNQFDLQIKEEVSEDFNCTQELEDELEELMESDMIILDPRRCVAMEYQMDPSTNASVTSNEEDMRTADEVALDIESSLKRLYKCSKCSFEGIHQEYRQHLDDEGHHAVKRPKAQVCLKRPEEKSLHCSKCGQDFPTPYKYVIHFSKDHNYEPRTCPKCYHTLPTTHALHMHIISHVRENFPRMYLITSEDDTEKEHRLHQCQVCSEPVHMADCFDHWERHLELNADAAQPEKKVSAPKVRTGDDGELKRMILLLQGINPDSSDEKVHNLLKSCVKCKKNFVRRNECKRHFIEHLLLDAVQHRPRDGFIKCQICAEEFANGEKYKRHMRDHGNLPLYKCDLCDKAFSDSSNFSKHKKVHNLSVVICDICNKKFTAKRFLEQHIKMHEVTEPLVCNECGKLFYSESSYRRHMRKGRSQFKCKVCYMKFNSLKNMWDHMWEEHRVRKLIADCPICHKSFRKHQDVKRHLREDHDNRYYKYEASKMVPRRKANKRPARAGGVAGLVVVAHDEGRTEVRKCGSSTAPKQTRAVKRKRLPVLRRVIALQDPQTQGTPETITRPAQGTASPVQGTASPVQGTASPVQNTAKTCSTASKQRKTMKRIRLNPRIIALQDPQRQGTPETITHPAHGTASPVQGTASPIQGTASPVQRTASRVHGTASPIQGTTSPVQRIASRVHGTASPIQGAARVHGTASPIQGAASPVQRTASRIQGTASPVQRTASRVHGTASPIQGTASPVQRTASRVHGTASPIQGTASSVQGIASPVQDTASSELETVVKTEPVES